VRLVLAFGALSWLRLSCAGFASLAGWPPRTTSTNVIAWRDQAPTPSVRVVFLTTLQSFDPRRAAVPAWISTPAIGLLLIALVIADLTVHRNPFRLPDWAGTLALGLLWIALCGRIWWLVRPPDAPDVGDNRTGLGLLLELARSWTGARSAPIETRFVAAGGWGGLQALVRAMARECPGTPTLLVEWLDPGIGPALGLVEHRTGRLAGSAAADLWIPHRVLPVSRACRRHWPWRDADPGTCYVGMAGSAIGKARTIDPHALGRAAQLVTEVALRWARRNRGSGDGS
jgi:hypothetical protein